MESNPPGSKSEPMTGSGEGSPTPEKTGPSSPTMGTGQDVPSSDHPGPGGPVMSGESTSSSELKMTGTALDQMNANLMGDAPACDVCGSITVRNGTCYKCNNCGNSMGCS